MIRNYFITSIRNLFREKGSTVINIAGLTLGITCSLVLFLLVKHLASFDSFHTNRDRIYRVVTESDGNNGKFYTPGVPPVLPDAFRQDFPEAEEVTFISSRTQALITIPQRTGESLKFHEDNGVAFSQPNFFKIFDRKIVMGSAAKGLDDPNEAIISQSLAKKYFGKEDVIGEILRYDTMEYKITAVMQDHPVNTDVPFNLMLSFASIKKAKDAIGWNSITSDEQCFILLKDGEQAATIEKRIPAFVDKYLGEKNYGNETFVLQSLRDMHFDDRYQTFSQSSAPRERIIALGVVALFLIVTACINFINLATAEAIKRSKEVGIRKSLGSTRSQLIGQFLGETSMVTIISMLMSLGLAELMLTFINSYMELSLALNFASDAMLWVFIIGVTVIVSLLSGLYPSLVISGFRPALALKNQISSRSSAGFNLRRSLVVLQFVISQFFIIGTIVLIDQMNYFQKQELGFKKDAILIIPVPEQEKPVFGDGFSKMRTLREELSALAGVEDVSLNSAPPSSGSVSGTGFYFEGQDESERIDTQVKQIDGRYIGLYEIELLAGTNIGDLDTATGFLVNEQLTKAAGFETPDEIVGKKIRMWGKILPVVGVVRDFHTVSLHEPIEPTVLMNRVRGYDNLSVRMHPGEFQQTLAQIRTKWERAYPDHIFDYEFLDEHIHEFYEGEEKMAVLFSIFTSMAIFIGCLGLFGLATFMANQKTKEIGVRKALGASVESIVLLFTKEYVKLIVIGFLIAAPFAWFVMNLWLEDFAYRITLGPAIFIMGFGITLTIAILTVGYKSLKAAIVNPVKALRYE